MLRISLRIEAETLFLAHKLAMDECQRLCKDRFSLSLRQELWAKLGKACFNYTNNPNGKPRTLTLSYHLASTLNDCIAKALDSNRIEGFYEKKQNNVILQ